MTAIKKLLIIAVILSLSYSATSQFTFKENIKYDNVFLPQLITNKSPLKQKIANNYYFFGQTKGNNLIIYLACKNNDVFIKGKRGAYFVLIPRELWVNEAYMRILFLDSDRNVIEAAYVPNLEDIMCEFVKILPGANSIADQVEFYAEKLGIGKLERENQRESLLTRDNFNGIGLNWDSQYDNGQWTNAHYIRVEIPFYNNGYDVERLIKQNGVGLFYYFQSSVLNNPSGVYMEFSGGDPNVNDQSVLEETKYLIKVKGGGGVNTETKLRFDLGMVPNYISGRGDTDATDGVRVGIATSNEVYIDIRGNSWTTVHNFSSRYLYVTLNSKWGTEKDSWAEIKVSLPYPYEIAYQSIDNNTDDLEYVKIEPLVTLNESFKDFIKKFYSDNQFQKARIKWPLQGEFAEDNGLGIEEKQWTRSNIGILTQISTEKAPYDVLSKNSVQQEYIIEGGALGIKLTFEKINEYWFLVSYKYWAI